MPNGYGNAGRRPGRRPLGRVIAGMERADRANRVMPADGSIGTAGPLGGSVTTTGSGEFGGYVAWVTEEVGPADGSTSPLTPGTGLASLGKFDASGRIVDSGRVAKVWNWSLSTFAVGEKVSLQYKYRRLFVDGADCPGG